MGRQLQIAQFLHCFEFENDSNMSFADACAELAGFDTTALHTFFDNTTSRLAAWEAVTTGANSTFPTSDIQCFPWVTLDGTVISKDPDAGCLGASAATYP